MAINGVQKSKRDLSAEDWDAIVNVSGFFGTYLRKGAGALAAACSAAMRASTQSG